VGLKLNGTYQVLTYADDVNLPGDNIDSKKKYIESLIDSSKYIDLGINIEKTMYIVAASISDCRSKSAHKDSKQIV
jgi:hypothetical protein